MTMTAAGLRGVRAATGERLLSAAACLAGIVNVFKGITTHPVADSELYWLFTYRYGFMKRALVGTLVSPLLRVWTFDQLRPAIAAAHLTACLAIVAACGLLFHRGLDRERRGDGRLLLSAAFLLLMSSQLLPNLAHYTGYVDPYIVLLVLGAFWLLLHERYAVAAGVAACGPLLHEAFIFLWSSVALLLLWSSLHTDRHRWQKIAAAVAPVMATALVLLLHSRIAEQRAVLALPITGAEKSGLLTYTVSETVSSSLAHMSREFHDRFSNFVSACGYFLLPSVLLLWCIVLCHGGLIRRRGSAAVVAVAATFLPLTIFGLAWDLSRFLVWSNLAAALALIAFSSPAFVSIEESR